MASMLDYFRLGTNYRTNNVWFASSTSRVEKSAAADVMVQFAGLTGV